MKTLLMKIISLVKNIYVKNGFLYISFTEEASPDLIDFFVRNVSISVISPQKEVMYSNPLAIFEKVQYIEKLCLQLTTNVTLGKSEKVIHIRKPIGVGDTIQFRGKGISLGEFIVKEGPK